jgi:hypothetical protein
MHVDAIKAFCKRHQLACGASVLAETELSSSSIGNGMQIWSQGAMQTTLETESNAMLRIE